MFAAWTNNLSDYEDEGYSDIDEDESDEEFNQKTEGNTHIVRDTHSGRRDDLVVSALDSGSSSPGLSACRAHCIVLLGLSTQEYK